MYKFLEFKNNINNCPVYYFNFKKMSVVPWCPKRLNYVIHPTYTFSSLTKFLENIVNIYDFK